MALEETSPPRLSEGGDYGWISPALGAKVSGPLVTVEQKRTLPTSLATLIDLSGKTGKLRFRLHMETLEKGITGGTILANDILVPEWY